MSMVEVETAEGGHIKMNGFDHAVAHVCQLQTLFVDNVFDHLILVLLTNNTGYYSINKQATTIEIAAF